MQANQLKTKIDGAYILAAGKGTRMGEVGKYLPKVRWPIFNQELLQTQISYARYLFAKNNDFPVFLNLWFQKDQILKSTYLMDQQQKKSILIEEELLGVGGSVYNLAKNVNYQGIYFLNNADQFLPLTESEINQALELAKLHPVVIFATKVSQKLKHSQITFSQNDHGVSVMKGIVQAGNTTESEYYTYSGSSLINFAIVSHRKVEFLDYFTSVADYQHFDVPIVFTQNPYWDFGTIYRYQESMRKLFEILNSRSQLELKAIDPNVIDPFVKFCFDQKVLDEQSLMKNQYHSPLMHYYFDHHHRENDKLILGDELMNIDQTPAGISFQNYYSPWA